MRTMQGLATVEILAATDTGSGIFTFSVTDNPISTSGLVVTPESVGEGGVVAVGIISFDTNSGSANYREASVRIKNLDGSDYSGSIDLHVSYQTV